MAPCCEPGAAPELAGQPAAVEVRASHIAEGAQGLFATRRLLPEQLLVEELPIAAVQRTATGGSMRSVYDKLMASGHCEALTRDGCLWTGPPSGPHDEGYREWAERCLAPEEDPQAAVTAMLAFTFNAYATTGKGELQVVYPTISKANHSCMPNAVVTAPVEGPGRIVCSREIAPGEEVLVSYLNDEELTFPADARNRKLTDHWEFQCVCKRCRGLAEDVRRFACPVGCGGTCRGLRPEPAPGAPVPAAAAAAACDACGAQPPPAVAAAWEASEREVETLLEGLPETLYSAWALSEDFATAHPEHWLAGAWKLVLANRTDHDVEGADTASEAEELRAEAATHRAAADRCRSVLMDLALG